MWFWAARYRSHGFKRQRRPTGFAKRIVHPLADTEPDRYLNSKALSPPRRRRRLLRLYVRLCRLLQYMRRPNVLHAGRAEQISAKTRMPYRAVADDIDERGFASPQCTFQGRAKLLRPLDVLTVTIHKLEHSVVALVR